MEAVQLRGQKHLIARGSQPNVLCVYFVADEDADNFHEASGADVIKQLLCVWGWEKKKFYGHLSRFARMSGLAIKPL